MLLPCSCHAHAQHLNTNNYTNNYTNKQAHRSNCLGSPQPWPSRISPRLIHMVWEEVETEETERLPTQSAGIQCCEINACARRNMWHECTQRTPWACRALKATRPSLRSVSRSRLYAERRVCTEGPTTRMAASVVSGDERSGERSCQHKRHSSLAGSPSPSHAATRAELWRKKAYCINIASSPVNGEASIYKCVQRL